MTALDKAGPDTGLEEAKGPKIRMAIAFDQIGESSAGRVAGLLIAIVVFAIVVFALRKLAGEVTYGDVVSALSNTAPADIVLAILATIGSYGFLAFYDLWALRFVGQSRPFATVAFVSFLAYAVGNTAGFGPLSGGAVRYRFYSRLGLTPEQIAKVIGYVTVAFGAGLAISACVALLIVGPAVTPELNLPTGTVRLGSLVGLVGLAAVYLFIRRRFSGDGPIGTVPAPSLVFRQILTTAGDLTLSCLALYVLLPQGSPGFPAFFAIYVVAIAAGVLSHVPAGLGVFETIVIAAMPRSVPTDVVLSALLIYRLIYHVGPLAAAAVAVAVSEARQLSRRPATRRSLEAGAKIAPIVLSAMTVLAGLMLVFSSVTPTPGSDIDFLASEIPLPLAIIETAHFASGILGVLLFASARGLALRLDGAWWAVIVMSLTAILLCFAKALAIYEAVFLILLVVVLVLTRRRFDRPASLLRNALSGPWLFAISIVLIASAGILLFAYDNVAYSDDIWIEFEFASNAPRSLRAIVGIAVVAAALALWSLIRPAAKAIEHPTSEDIAKSVSIVMRQNNSDANLIRCADKSILFSKDGDAFLMFGRHGRTWASFLEPIGNASARAELIWHFVELARESGGRAALYQVPPSVLAICADAGLRAIKLGETAIVDLSSFELKGARRSALRQTVSRGNRDGLEFQYLEASAVSQVYEEISAVSDRWLSTKNAREKRFSVGWFDRDYMLSQPLAILRKDGRIVAFANVLLTDTKAEAAIDLMRFAEDAPRSSMEYCLIKLMLHLRDEGFTSFNLGMAPLSGLAAGPAAPIWNRVGSLIFENAEHFYNFRGLRSFKSKFDPEWQPRYLAVAGGLNPIIALADISQLIGGGLKGVVSK